MKHKISLIGTLCISLCIGLVSCDDNNDNEPSSTPIIFMMSDGTQITAGTPCTESPNVCPINTVAGVMIICYEGHYTDVTSIHTGQICHEFMNGIAFVDHLDLVEQPECTYENEIINMGCAHRTSFDGFDGEDFGSSIKYGTCIQGRDNRFYIHDFSTVLHTEKGEILPDKTLAQQQQFGVWYELCPSNKCNDLDPSNKTCMDL